jgi:hypothetical protein
MIVGSNERKYAWMDEGLILLSMAFQRRILIAESLLVLPSSRGHDEICF